jgi:hypothetical protein
VLAGNFVGARAKRDLPVDTVKNRLVLALYYGIERTT